MDSVYAIRRTAVRSMQALGLNVIASKVYYNLFHGFRSASPGLDEGFETIFRVAERLKLFDGDGVYCEFGVFKGYSFWKAQQLVSAAGHDDTHFFGYDSFEGLPAIGEADLTGHHEFREGQYARSLSAVRQNLDKAGVDWNRTFLTKGFFSESLTEAEKEKLTGRKVVVAMIDCDLYNATVDVLKWLDGLLAPVSILIMDDWNCFDRDDRRGQRRALSEFMARHGDASLEPIADYGLNSRAFLFRSPSPLSSDLCSADGGAP